MRCARPMASLAALLRRLFVFQCLHVCRLRKALVLVLVATLAYLGAGVLGRIAMPVRCFLGQRWEINEWEQTRNRKQGPTQSMTSWLHELLPNAGRKARCGPRLHIGEAPDLGVRRPRPPGPAESDRSDPVVRHVKILAQQRDYVQACFAMLTQEVQEILAPHHGDLGVVQ